MAKSSSCEGDVTVAGLEVMEKYWERNGEEGGWREEVEALGAPDNEEQ